MRRTPVLVVAPLAALAAALIVVMLAGAGGGARPARPAAPGQAAAPVAGPPSRAARWLDGRPGTLLAAVSADLGRLSAAERAGAPGGARRAGSRLSADARAALLGPPPPRGAGRYRAALAELARAGRSAAAGRFRAAGASLAAGESGITRATAAVDAPAAAGPQGGAGAVAEPPGQ